MNEPPIQIQNASRSFDGVPVIKNLSVSIRAGSIYGFLGTQRRRQDHHDPDAGGTHPAR